MFDKKIIKGEVARKGVLFVGEFKEIEDEPKGGNKGFRFKYCTTGLKKWKSF